MNKSESTVVLLRQTQAKMRVTSRLLRQSHERLVAVAAALMEPVQGMSRLDEHEVRMPNPPP